MLSLIIPILNSVLGGIIKPFVAAWSDYERTKLTTGEAGFAAGAAVDSAVMQAALAADAQMAALKVQLYGTPTYRIIALIAGLPPAIHFGLVYIDTILASKAFLGAAYFGVPKLPTPYDTFEWAVVSSFFLVHAVNLGKSNVAAWLGRK
ncbi:MAG: hypothetical protein ACREO5_00605 [Candidatus Binatia bacterium]